MDAMLGALARECPYTVPREWSLRARGPVRRAGQGGAPAVHRVQGGGGQAGGHGFVCGEDRGVRHAPRGRAAGHACGEKGVRRRGRVRRGRVWGAAGSRPRGWAWRGSGAPRSSMSSPQQKLGHRARIVQGTLLYCSVLYWTGQYRTVQDCVPSNTPLTWCTLLYSTMQYRDISVHPFSCPASPCRLPGTACIASTPGPSTSSCRRCLLSTSQPCGSCTTRT